MPWKLEAVDYCYLPVQLIVRGSHRQLLWVIKDWRDLDDEDQKDFDFKNREAMILIMLSMMDDRFHNCNI
jgi:hypothetical protein